MSHFRVKLSRILASLRVPKSQKVKRSSFFGVNSKVPWMHPAMIVTWPLSRLTLEAFTLRQLYDPALKKLPSVAGQFDLCGFH
jgi:hypothetical protein